MFSRRYIYVLYSKILKTMTVRTTSRQEDEELATSHRYADKKQKMIKVKGEDCTQKRLGMCDRNVRERDRG